VLYHAILHELDVDGDRATLAGWRCRSPIAGRSRSRRSGWSWSSAVDGQKRTIMLPATLTSFRPTDARRSDGALRVSFDSAAQQHAAPTPAE